MDLRLDASELALQAELREWLGKTLPRLPPPPGPEDWPARRRFDTDWQRRLHDAGYAGISWPREYGGRGASPTEELVFLEEMARAKAPNVGVNFVGLMHAGPTLIAEGSSDQKRAHLPRILRGEEVWCQGFSEPEAGSDLAALRTRATRDGDEYVVTGQKIWTSFGQVADQCELLVRTDDTRHRGITWLILSMALPGIEVRPLRTVTRSAEFSELFLDEVRVPVVNRVGEENDGWRVAMVTFGFERGTGFVSDLVEALRVVEDLATLARKLPAGRGVVWDDRAIRRDLGSAAAELDALWALTKRNASQVARAGALGPGGSVLKLHYSEVRDQIGELSMRILGRAALAQDDIGGLPTGFFVEERLRTLALSIGGGTSQIQRNIIGERILGLPKEPPAT